MKLYKCASPACPGYPWKASERPHPCPVSPEAPIGVSYHLPREVAIRNHHSHYGHGFYPLQPEDLKTLDEDLVRWLIERKKQAPVILDEMPSAESVIRALKGEKRRLEKARDELLACQQAEIQEILDGAPESFWEIAICNATETYEDITVNYPEYYVREFLQLKDEPEIDWEPENDDLQAEIEVIKYGLMIRAHIEHSPRIRQAMANAESYHKELVIQAERMTEEARQQAQHKAEEIYQTQKRQQELQQTNLELLINWGVYVDRRIRLGCKQGYDMSTAILETLDNELTNWWTTEERWAVADDGDYLEWENENPSKRALEMVDNLEKIIADGGNWSWPDVVEQELGRICHVRGRDELKSTVSTREAIKIEVSVPMVYNRTIYLLLEEA